MGMNRMVSSEFVSTDPYRFALLNSLFEQQIHYSLNATRIWSYGTLISLIERFELSPPSPAYAEQMQETS